MMKTLKTTIVAMAILAMGLFLMNTNAQQSTDVNLEVTQGNLSITASGAIDLGSVMSPTVNTDLTGDFSTNSFYVTDYKGDVQGYRTTIQVTDLTGDISGTEYTIPAANVEFKAGAADPVLMDGTPNAEVTLALTTTYTPIGGVVNYFMRGNTTIGGVLSQYGDTPSIKVTVPAFQAATTYHGVITYTLIEPGV